MNRSYSENSSFNSNNGILDSFYTEIVGTTDVASSHVEQLIEKLLKARKALTGIRARRMIRAFSVALSLIGLIGVAGAVELGNLSPLAGLLLGAVMVTVEVLCLKPHGSDH